MPKKINKKGVKSGGNIFSSIIDDGQNIISTGDSEYGNRNLNEQDWANIFGGGAYHELQGDGFMDWVKNLGKVLLNPKKSLSVVPKPVSDFLSKYGDYRIMSMKVCREPLSSAIVKFADKVTSGQFSINRKNQGYDDVFHLYLSLQIMAPTGGQVYKVLLEKNQRVKLEISNKEVKEGGSCVPIQFNKIVTLNDLVMTNVNDQSWVYDAFKLNCQHYVSERLRSVGLLDAPTAKFINQDVEALLPNKVLQSIVAGTTSLANILENVWKGGELQK